MRALIKALSSKNINGVRPFSILNIILAAIFDVTFLMIVYAVKEDLIVMDKSFVILVLLCVLSLIIVILRNRKMNDTKAFVGNTIILLLLAGVLAIVTILIMALSSLGGGSGWSGVAELWGGDVEKAQKMEKLERDSQATTMTYDSSYNDYSYDQEVAAHNSGYASAKEANAAGAQWSTVSNSWVK